jgi:hypothetical protein
MVATGFGRFHMESPKKKWRAFGGLFGGLYYIQFKNAYN